MVETTEQNFKIKPFSLEVFYLKSISLRFIRKLSIDISRTFGEVHVSVHLNFHKVTKPV